MYMRVHVAILILRFYVGSELFKRIQREEAIAAKLEENKTALNHARLKINFFEGQLAEIQEKVSQAKAARKELLRYLLYYRLVLGIFPAFPKVFLLGRNIILEATQEELLNRYCEDNHPRKMHIAGIINSHFPEGKPPIDLNLIVDITDPTFTVASLNEYEEELNMLTPRLPCVQGLQEAHQSVSLTLLAMGFAALSFALLIIFMYAYNIEEVCPSLFINRNRYIYLSNHILSHSICVIS
jgi:hypothetical protein